ncbi:TolC family protein [uncultured Bacteroides sp.]|uniref:TolC family protein n=1 Tax=uncultured Bacteroides sp. TaxID=162156 RepID=UPI002AAAB7F5|nr:TolC family protein [uncultured Bacteroides sp.]
MKRIMLGILFVTIIIPIRAQVTLDACQKKTRENYPLVRQYGLIERTKEYNLSNASKGNLPQFSLSGKATYQSAVTKLGVQIPGVSIKSLAKDQYQVVLEMQQNIWDGGNIRTQKELVKTNSDVDREKLNVDMYALTERVNDLFFGVLMLDEQLKQNKLLQEQLGRTFRQVSAYVDNGIANSADLDAVKVEQLNTTQKHTELLASKQAYIKMLSVFTGDDIADTATFERPEAEVSTPSLTAGIYRPEIFWFEAQNGRLKVNEQALKVRNLPRLNLFVQGAYGNPGLNMLKNEFTPYYLGGVKLTWNFGGLYTFHNDKRLIEANRQQLFSNRDVFLFNTRLQATQQTTAIESMRTLMQKDEEIISLRANIRKAAEAKVANGTLTVTDMLREITSESLAKQTKALHEVQLLMDIYKLKYITNN